MMETKTRAADAVLYELVTSCATLGLDLPACFDRMHVPVVATKVVADPQAQDVLYCNEAACELTGHGRNELVGRPMQAVYGESADSEVLRRFSYGVEREGYDTIILALSLGRDVAKRVELQGLRISGAAGLGAGDVLVFLLRPLPPVMSASEAAPLSESFRTALLLETLLRRYIRQNYRQGMHPAQWSALRYFKLAAPEERTLTSFAKAHHTTMGTASTTVSTLVGKGYLKKHGFRGPIEITGRGETVLQQDPLGAVADILAGMDANERQWARQTLMTLADGLNGDAE